jgi:hypothetical protein
MRIEVINGTLEERRIIFERSNASITSMTKQRSHFASSMAMVNCQSANTTVLLHSFWTLAESAQTALNQSRYLPVYM